MSKKRIHSLSLTALAIAAAVAVTGPASAEPAADGRDTDLLAVESEGVDRIAMFDIEVDIAARTFSFETSERFGGPYEHVLVRWTGTDAGFNYAVTSIAKYPRSVFHVFRLYNWKDGKADCKYYYHTAG